MNIKELYFDPLYKVSEEVHDFIVGLPFFFAKKNSDNLLFMVAKAQPLILISFVFVFLIIATKITYRFRGPLRQARRLHHLRDTQKQYGLCN